MLNFSFLFGLPGTSTDTQKDIMPWRKVETGVQVIT